MPVVHLKDISVPSGLVGWLLTDDRGRPRYWSTVWSALDGASLAPSTLRTQLSVIEQLYQSARRLYQADCLDCLIAELKFDELEACLETFFITARNHGAQTAANYHPNWRVAYVFVKSCVQRLVKSHADPDMLWLLSMRLERLEKLFDSLGMAPAPPAEIVRALPSPVLDEFYQIIDPYSVRNPFRNSTLRWRNYVLCLLMLHLGLRRGETLVLPMDALKSEKRFTPTVETVNWLNVGDNPYQRDPRQEQPSLKNNNAARQLPVPPALASLIRTFVESYRPSTRHSYLFSSLEGNPLSLRQVNGIFVTITGELTTEARQSLQQYRGASRITPHDMRHTCATVRLHQFVENGDDLEMAIQRLRAFFGWARTSDMPRRYARAFFEDRLATVWNHAFDVHVSHLRS